MVRALSTVSISIYIFFFFLLTLIIISSFSLSLSVFVSLSLVFSSLGRGDNATSTAGSAAMPPLSFFGDQKIGDQNFTETYGSWCKKWLNPDGKLGICANGDDCTKGWCYVAADADCDPSQTFTPNHGVGISFYKTEFASSLKFSTDPCVDVDSSSSSASTFLTSTIVMSLVGLMMM